MVPNVLIKMKTRICDTAGERVNVLSLGNSIRPIQLIIQAVGYVALFTSTNILYVLGSNPADADFIFVVRTYYHDYRMHAILHR